jgi:hypothetical protein
LEGKSGAWELDVLDIADCEIDGIFNRYRKKFTNKAMQAVRKVVGGNPDRRMAEQVGRCISAEKRPLMSL